MFSTQSAVKHGTAGHVEIVPLVPWTKVALGVTVSRSGAQVVVPLVITHAAAGVALIAAPPTQPAQHSALMAATRPTPLTRDFPLSLALVAFPTITSPSPPKRVQQPSV